MKRQILFIFTLILTLSVIAQHESDAVQIKVGVGLSNFKTEQTSKISIGSIDFTAVDTVSHSSKTIPFSLMMGIRDPWSMGVYGRIGNYVLDSTDTDSRKDKIYSFGLMTDVYFINNEIINMYLNAGAHFTMLTIYETTALVSNEYKYIGWGPAFNFGMNIFPFPVVGINLNVGYEGQNLNLNEWFINDNPQSMDNIEVKLKGKGLHLGAGLTFMF
jgi:hypothetical protein